MPAYFDRGRIVHTKNESYISSRGLRGYITGPALRCYSDDLQFVLEITLAGWIQGHTGYAETRQHISRTSQGSLVTSVEMSAISRRKATDLRQPLFLKRSRNIKADSVGNNLVRAILSGLDINAESRKIFNLTHKGDFQYC